MVIVPVQTLLASSLAFPKALCIPSCLDGRVCFGETEVIRQVWSAVVQLTGFLTPCLPAAFPKHVELDPLPTWQQVGKNLTLRCLVDGGTPQSQLSVMLLRGEKVLYRQPVDVDRKNPKEITTTVPVSRDDHEANFSCRTELDLRPQGLELFPNVSMTRQLRTFGEALGTRVFLHRVQVGPWEEADPCSGGEVLRKW